ncbi:hypothetical protein INT45_007550 [Circinella minor]|uniref:Profilin n=1 Tax=Circinella minor TaxID=1195481 RepID=A0A8H7VPD5_9FUNG|nr:hypothetical protein INT45_007550 [Circinella minor]
MKTKQDTNGETVIDWQSYVDDDLMGSSRVNEAAIYDFNGSKLASTPDFTISDSEFKEIANGFNGTAPFTEKKDVTIVETPYSTVSSDDKELFSGESISGGVLIYKTGAVYLIVTYDDSIEPEACKSAVESLTEYFKDEGW